MSKVPKAINDFALALASLQDKAGRLELYETMHAIHEASRVFPSDVIRLMEDRVLRKLPAKAKRQAAAKQGKGRKG